VAEPIPPPTPAQLVVLRSLLIPLMRFSGLVVALGLIFCVDAWVRAMFGTLTGSIGWIPYIGRVVTSPLHRIEQKVTSYLGGLEAHIDVSMGAFFHNLAIAVDMLASGQAEIAWLSWLMAHALKVAHGVTKVLPSITHITKVTKIVQHETTIIRREVVRAGKVAAHAAPAILTLRVGAIAAELDHALDWTIPRLRARERATEGELGRLWKRVRANERRGVVALGLAAIVAALAKLGLGWARCSNVKKAGRRLCGMDTGLLDSLLLDTIAIVGTVSLIEFIRDAQAIEAVALDALGGFIRELPQV
jgi:hypothetical protein